MSSLNKQQRRNYLVLLIMIFGFSFQSKAQKTSNKENRMKDSVENPSRGFHKGYIVLRESGDTVKGYLKWHVFMDNSPEWVLRR
jgi:hypothetical protein